MNSLNLRPSSSHRWLACPGSLKAEASYSEEVSSEYALEGTLAHAVAEAALTGSVTHTKSLVGKTFDVEGEMMAMPNDMAEHIDSYVSFVHEVQGRNGELFIEKKFALDEWLPGCVGTSDAAILGGCPAHNPKIQQSDLLTIIDLKYGKGVKVTANENSQLYLYALGAMRVLGHLADIETVRIIIFQPRLDHISEVTVAASDLYSWGEGVIKPGVKKVLGKRPRRIAGDHCRFCKARFDCSARVALLQKKELEHFRNENEVPGIPSKQLLDEATLARILSIKPVLTQFLADMEESARKRIIEGKEVPGWKLVEGRSIRKWKNEDQAVKHLASLLKEHEMYTRKLISPAQAEKTLGKTGYNAPALVEKPPGKPTLVPEADRRSALSYRVEEEFKDETNVTLNEEN